MGLAVSKCLSHQKWLTYDKYPIRHVQSLRASGSRWCVCKNKDQARAKGEWASEAPVAANATHPEAWNPLLIQRKFWVQMKGNFTGIHWGSDNSWRGLLLLEHVGSHFSLQAPFREAQAVGASSWRMRSPTGRTGSNLIISNNQPGVLILAKKLRDQRGGDAIRGWCWALVGGSFWTCGWASLAFKDMYVPFNKRCTQLPAGGQAVNPRQESTASSSGSTMSPKLLLKESWAAPPGIDALPWCVVQS